MSTYEPTIRDRVRIALALTIIQDKKHHEDLETCILRFRGHFPQTHQRQQLRRPLRPYTTQYRLHEDYHDDEHDHSQEERWQAKTRAMQVQIDSLTKQLADREADVSMLQADLEAIQPVITNTGIGAGKSLPKKKQKKTGPLANDNSNNASNLDVAEREGDIGSEGAVLGAGMGAGAGAAPGKKKPGKVGASQAKGAGVGIGQAQGQGEGQNGVFLMLSRKLDEILEEATNESQSTSRTAHLLSKLFETPSDITHHFLPLRLQAIFLHANDVVQTCSTYVEASIEAALHPSTAKVKGGISARIQFPGKLVQTIALLLQELVPLLSKAVGDIFKEIEILPGFDHAEFKTRWSDLKVAIGTGVIMPSIKAIKKTSDKVWAENQARLLSARGSRTRFMNQAIGQAEANQRDIREGLVKLLLTLSRCQMMALTTKNAATGNREDGTEHPLAEMVAFGTTTELVEILQPGPNSAAIRSRVVTFGSSPHTHLGFGGPRTEEISADQETVQVLLVILRTSIPYLPCHTSDGFGTAETRSDYLVDNFLKRQIEPEEISPRQKTGAKVLIPPPGLLLGMTIRSQLVQLLSPIVQPITSALYDCFSSYKPTAQQDVSIPALLQENRALKDALMQVAEELMLAEGEEQGGIADWVIQEIEPHGIKSNEMKGNGHSAERETVRVEGEGLMDTGDLKDDEKTKEIQHTTGQAAGSEVETTPKPSQDLSTVIIPNAVPSVVEQPENVPAPESEAIPKHLDIAMDIAAVEESFNPASDANNNVEPPQQLTTIQNSLKVRDEPEQLPTLHDPVKTVGTPGVASCYNEDLLSLEPTPKILLGRVSSPIMNPSAVQELLSTSSSSNQSLEAIPETIKPSTPIAEQPVLPITPENPSMEKVQTSQLVDTSIVVTTSVSDHCSPTAKLPDEFASLSDLQIASGLNNSNVADQGVEPSVLHPSVTQSHTR